LALPTLAETDAAASAPTPARAGSHPRGLYTLFFTEMWERFSYYGMRALLVLFLVDRVRGGFGLSDQVATAIYGLYTASVYLAALPGGWVSDRILGAQRSVWYGGIIIACGHFTMAVNRVETFYLGLMLIVLGTGLLKPNISAMVGELYPEGGARRDSGFTLFYMGINLGAALGPIVCGALAQKAWRLGFAAAGFGMVLGLIQFHFTRRHLGGAGKQPGTSTPLPSRTKIILGALALLGVVFVGLVLSGIVHLDAPKVADWVSYLFCFATLIYFTSIFAFGRLTRDEKGRVGLIIILFAAATLFWAGFEQVGSSFNLFAERFTDRNLFGSIIPAAAFQSLGPIFIISLAPVAAAIWLKLASKNISIPTKFGLGLIFLALGFVVMAMAARIVAGGHNVGPFWLTATYFIHTVGELCLSPVGLSSVTKLSPKRLVGQMMGVWFLAASLGNLLAGLLAGKMIWNDAAKMSGQFLQIGILPAAAGVLLILLARPLRRHLADVK
jgi:POT family proton-dependent oligopeptide transporter